MRLGICNRKVQLPIQNVDVHVSEAGDLIAFDIADTVERIWGEACWTAEAAWRSIPRGRLLYWILHDLPNPSGFPATSHPRTPNAVDLQVSTGKCDCPSRIRDEKYSAAIWVGILDASIRNLQTTN